MNARNIFISLVLLIGLIFLSTSVTQATTYYVNLGTGLDGYDGKAPTVTGEPGVGPKLTINNAIGAASSTDTISVAYANGNLYDETVVVGNGSASTPGSKKLTFVSTGGTPNVKGLTVNNGLASPDNTIIFIGPYKLTTTLTLQKGAVIGAGNLTVGGTITRYALSNTTSSTVDAQLLYTGTVAFVYQTAGFTITTGQEMPPTSDVTTIGAVTTAGAGTVTLGESKTMNGILTTAAALDLGGGTLTIKGGAAHTIGGAVSNGTLAFTMTGATSVAGAQAVPNISASASSAATLTLAATVAENVSASGAASVTLSAATPVGNISNSGTGTVLASAAITIGSITNSGNGVVTATLATTVGVVSNSGTTAANIVNLTAATTIAGITNSSLGSVISSSVAAVSVTGNILQTGAGSIAFASTAGVTVAGSTTNSPAIAFATSATASITQSNLGLITFAAGPHTFTGVVTNSPSFSGTTASGATFTTTWTNNGQIRFASTTQDLTFTGGIVVGATSSLVNGGIGTTGISTISGNGAITFASTLGNILASGGISNSTNWPHLTAVSGQGAITQTMNGTIWSNSQTGGSYGTSGNPIGPVISTSISADSSNGDLVFASTSGATAFFGTTIDCSGPAGGVIWIGNINTTLSGNVTNNRTSAHQSGDIKFGSTPTAGVTISISGNIENKNASSIVIWGYRGAAATLEDLSVAGSLINSGTGAIRIYDAPMTNGTVTLGGINITDGEINLSGGGAATTTITINGTTNFLGGKVTLTTSGARTLQLGGLTNNFSTATTTTDFTTAGNVTLLVQATTIFGAQTMTGAAKTTVWYGAANINNTHNNAVIPGVAFSGGDFRFLKTVTFAGSKVNINNMTVFVGSQALASAGNFVNTIGYTTTGNGFVSMNGNAAMAISGVGTFSNFEVDATGMVATVAAGTGIFTGIFNLTAGSVSCASAVDGATDISFNNATTYPTIVKNAGSFAYIPTFTSMVNVYYIGIDQSSGKELPTNATKLNNLTVATTNGTNVAGKGVVAILNCTTTVNGIINIHADQALMLSGTTVLSMNGATIQLDGDIVNAGGANALKFVRPLGTIVSGAGVLPDIIVDVKSFGNEINSSAGLATGLLGGDGLRGGTADLLPGNGGSITFNANGGTDTSSLKVTFAAANATSKVHLGTGGAGAYAATAAKVTTAKGGRLILGADLIQGTCLSNNASGTVNVGTFTYTVQGTTGNVVDKTSSTIGTGTLKFEMVGASTLSVSTGAATIASNVNVTTSPLTTAYTLSLTTNSLTVSGNLTISGAATLDIPTGLTLTATGSSVTLASTAANNITGAGTLKLNAATPPLTFTYSGAPSITNLTISNDVNLAGTGTALTVTTLFKHEAGVLDFGDRDLTFQTAFTRTAGTAAYKAVKGYMIWDGVTVNQSTDGFTVPNLRVKTTSSLTDGATLDTVIVTKTFDLVAGTFTTYSKFAIADLATVNYTDGSISAIPTYANRITLVGNDFVNHAAFPLKIWPTTVDVTTLTIKGHAAVDTIDILGSRTVSKALTLTIGTLYVPATFTLTVADSSLITVDAGFLTKAGTVAYGNAINVQYVPSAANYSSNGIELPATVRNLSITRLTNTVNKTTTLKTPVTITGSLYIRNNLTTTAAAPITLNGDLIIALDAFAKATQPSTSFGATLMLAGTVNTRIIVPATPVTGIALSALEINKARSSNTVTLSGGNLDMSDGGVITFTRGLLLTDSYSYIWLDAAEGQSSQGFVRNVATGYLSHIVGNVQKTLKAGSTQIFGRNEFPVGSLVAYCPVAITIINAGGSTSLDVNVLVNHNSVSPTGIVGLPITDGVSTGVDISRYAALSWGIKSNLSLGSTKFDLELTAPGFTEYDDIANVRIIRRMGTLTDLTNTWSLQGADYDNFVVNNVPSVVNVGSIGGIRPEGAIFTYGMKTKIVVAHFDDVVIQQVGGAYSPNPYKLALAGKFTNGVGTLTYIASSTNTAVATVLVVHDTLKVTSLTDGLTTITVKATDANNDFATGSFSFQPKSTGVEVAKIPTKFGLAQNYPNPFNPTTNISFDIPQNSSVKIAIYDMLGREVATLVNANYAPGTYTVPFNASALSSGMYIYRMTSQSSVDQKTFTSTKKLMLVK